ncbi:hypothetical protein M8C21_033042 [Ambrosia artemisiifolia]|uniref:NAC domain-containing protein n=1 Tax=Ambrosia artemisiifolia TaxID=4212 RepID=A0AAD5CHE8_AMBAR|nr:hypothetical protein M8C21_033042 [Ambrosia artemisiifolia]
MCPQESIPPAVELNECSTDEVVFKSLMQIKSGCSLPSNVRSDVDPYQFTPSNLPAGVWYLWSGSKTDTEYGFWRPTGETCETCSSLITCLRKTHQFYEGTASDGQKTNLMMQEYTTNDKCNIQQDPRALYRVYLIDGSSSGTGSGRLSKSEVLVKKLDTVAGLSDVANQFPDQPSTVANQSSAQPSAVANQSQDQPSAVAYDSQDQPSALANQSPDRLLGDYVSSGDYLALDDLAIPLSRTTSADSSCMTRSVTSEDLFDSDALLCELGDDNVDHDSRLTLNLSAPAKLKEVVMQATTLESLDKESKPCTGQTSKTNSSPEREPRDRCNNSTSNEAGTSSSSSSSSEGSSKEEKKVLTKKRKMMKYLCFLAF